MFIVQNYQVQIIKKIFYLTLLLMSAGSFANNIPLMKYQIHRIEYPEGMQTLSAVVQSKGSLNVIYSHLYDHDWNSGELRYSNLKLYPDYIFSSKPLTINVESNKSVNLRTSVSGFTKNNVEWLYFVESETTYHKPASLYRAQWAGSNKLVNRQLVSLPTVIAAGSAPKLYLLNNGKIALVYRSKPYSGCCKLLFSVSNDGVHFDNPIEIGSAGAMPALAVFSSNEVIYTFQTHFTKESNSSDAKATSGMRSHFRLSKNNGDYWGEAIPITTRVQEVHDASPIQRIDGLVDLYYSSIDNPHENSSLSLWRRCVSTSGKLGPEELVVDKSFGNVAKVSPHRLSDGSLLLTFVEQGKVYSAGDHNIHAAQILSDAKCGV